MVGKLRLEGPVIVESHEVEEDWGEADRDFGAVGEGLLTGFVSGRSEHVVVDEQSEFFWVDQRCRSKLRINFDEE